MNDGNNLLVHAYKIGYLTARTVMWVSYVRPNQQNWPSNPTHMLHEANSWHQVMNKNDQDHVLKTWKHYRRCNKLRKTIFVLMKGHIHRCCPPLQVYPNYPWEFDMISHICHCLQFSFFTIKPAGDAYFYTNSVITTANQNSFNVLSQKLIISKLSRVCKSITFPFFHCRENPSLTSACGSPRCHLPSHSSAYYQSLTHKRNHLARWKSPQCIGKTGGRHFLQWTRTKHMRSNYGKLLGLETTFWVVHLAHLQKTPIFHLSFHPKMHVFWTPCALIELLFS